MSVGLYPLLFMCAPLPVLYVLKPVAFGLHLHLSNSISFEKPQRPFLEYRRRCEHIAPEPIRHAFSPLVAAAKSRRTPFFYFY